MFSHGGDGLLWANDGFPLKNQSYYRYDPITDLTPPPGRPVKSDALRNAVLVVCALTQSVDGFKILKTSTRTTTRDNGSIHSAVVEVQHGTL